MDEYQKWAEISKSLTGKEIDFHFNDKEIWWCHLGENIGFEENGKGENFLRPVLVFKKINKNLFWGIPLTTKYKNEYYKFLIGKVDGNINYALWQQLRVLSSKRLLNFYGLCDKRFFKLLKSIIKEFI